MSVMLTIGLWLTVRWKITIFNGFTIYKWAIFHGYVSHNQMVYQLVWDDLKEQTPSKFPKRLKLQTRAVKNPYDCPWPGKRLPLKLKWRESLENARFEAQEMDKMAIGQNPGT